MSRSILEIINIGKCYKNYTTELWRILSWFGIKHKALNEKWTLENINFSIKSGEAIGIIGQNGAGKSTLLKIITGTLKPTTGNVTVRGKIAAILELGMGFHPDLTGRQNAYHSAGLMGYSYEEIHSVISGIENFAEIGDYFDQPVRLYSSGMQVRVAFSVATAFRPEILIIDEALSVGDAYFQHKSFARIKEFRDAGTSLLFVSHDKGSILALCDRAILLEKGFIIKDGDPEVITDYYNALVAEKENNTIKQEKKDGKIVTISGTGEATIKEVKLYNSKNEKVEMIGVGDSVSLKVIVNVHKDLDILVLGYAIKDRLGQVDFGSNTWYEKNIIYNPQQNDEYTITIKFNANFGEGSYSIALALTDSESHMSKNYNWIDNAIIFNIVNLSKNIFVGLSWLEQTVEIRKLK